MSFGLPEFLRRNIAVRLSLYYALLFAATGVVLFVFAYYLLAAAVSSKDREVLEARMKEIATVYEAGGIGGLRMWVRNQGPQTQRSLFIRIVNVFNDVAVVSAPEDW